MRKYRIFLAIGGKATPGDNNNMWVKNLYDPLVILGHDVYLFNTDDYAHVNGLGYMSVEAKERLSNDLPKIFLKQHNKKPFDIFFSYLHNGQIIPKVLKEIKRHVYTINYSTNYHQFEMYKEVATIVDFNIYITKIAKEGFDSLGVQSYWMPLAANPAFYKPASIKNDHAVFIGSAYGPRAYLFWRLFQYGIDLQLYGYGWKKKESVGVAEQRKSLKGKLKDAFKNITGFNLERQQMIEIISLEDQLRQEYGVTNELILSLIRKDFASHLHPSVDDSTYVKTLAEAGTVINIQESRFNHDFVNHKVLFGSNLRDYEATMCGAFICTQYSVEVEELFEVGKELVCYHNEHDLAEKINYFDRHPSQKVAIASAGYRRSLQSHTWEKRFQDFFEHLRGLGLENNSLN